MHNLTNNINSGSNSMMNTEINSENSNSASTNATQFILKIFRLSDDFEDTKIYLLKLNNFYISFLFSKLGYEYEGHINSPNILHLSAQAWLLGVFHEIRKEEKLNKDYKITFTSLLSKIKQTIIEENTFIDNMKLLTGVYLLDEPVFTNSRIFKIFLLNIQNTKNQINIEEEIDKSQFEEIIIKVLRSAFNSCLNDFNDSEKDKTSLDLLNTFIEMGATGEESETDLNTYDHFFKLYLEKKKIKEDTLSDEEKRKLSSQLSNFYSFCICKAEDLTKEIQFFNQNAGSLKFILKKIFSVKNYNKLYNIYFKLLSNVALKGLKDMRLDSIIQFYQNYVLEIKDKSTNFISNKYQDGKKLLNWVNSSAAAVYDNYNEKYFNPYYTNFKGISVNLFHKIFYYPSLSFKQYIYQPINHLTIKVANSSIDVVLDLLNFGKSKKENLNKFISDQFEIIKNSLVGGNDPLVKIDYTYNNNDKREYLTLSISKKLFAFDIEFANKFFKNIVEKLIELINRPKQIGVATINYTLEKISSFRSCLYYKYKSFFDLESNDEDNVVELFANNVAEKIKSD